MTLPLVSAICLHRGEPWHLEQARATWAAQLWDGPKELMIVTSEQPAERPQVGERWLWQGEGTTLAQRRNAGISASSGKLTIQWDDDDVSGPNRLRIQLTPILRGECRATVLRNAILEDLVSERSAPCSVGGWPQTIAAERSLLEEHRYTGKGRGEDSRLLGAVYDATKILDNAPALYRYRYHGTNVSGLAHWNWLFRQAGMWEYRLADAVASYSDALPPDSAAQESRAASAPATSA